MNASTLTGLFADFAASSWRAAWLIVVLAGFRVLVRGRIPAGVWFVAWIIVAVRLLVPLSVPVSWSPYNLTAPRTPAAAATVPAIAGAPAPRGLPAGPMVTPLPDAAPPAAPAGHLTTETSLAFAWLGGAGFLLLLRAAAAWRFHRALKGAPDAGERVREMARRIAAAWRISHAPRCVETDAVDAPALYGLARPWVLFPRGFEAQLSDNELRLVLRHELAHWRRRDLLAQALLQVAVALHWFNPLAWLAARLARADCELACDEFVLRHEAAGGACAYGSALLKTFAVMRGRRRPGTVVAILEGSQQLAQRVRMIAGYRPSTAGRILGGLLLLAILAAASVTRESHAQETSDAALTVPASPTPASPAAADDRDMERKAQNQRQVHAVEQLQTTVEAQRRKVHALTRQLQDYKQTHMLGSPDQLRDLVGESFKAANLEYQRACLALETAAARVAQLQDWRARGVDLTHLPFIVSRPLVVELLQQISRQRTAVATLHERYRVAHPSLVAAKNALDQTQRELDRAVNAASDQIEAEERAASNAQQTSQQELERAKAATLELDRLGVEYRRIERELQKQDKILQSIVTPANEEISAAPAREEGAEFSVSVLGAVNAPGVVTLRRADQPIALDAIARAGGFAAHADRTAVGLLRADAHGTHTTTVLTEEILMNGRGLLQPRDVLMVPERAPAVPRRTATIMGAVNSPGIVAFPLQRNLTIADAITLAGGTTRLADLKQVRLTRTDPKTQATTVTTIDVDALLRHRDDAPPNVLLDAGDVLLVPERIL